MPHHYFRDHIMPWYYFSFLAAISWGLYYPLSELLLKRYSTPSLIVLLHLSSCLFFFIFFNQKIKEDFLKNPSAQITDILLFLSLMSIGIFANYVGFQAISLKNATLAAFLEISYPLFAALFSLLLIKQAQLNLWTFSGGSLLILGVMIILLKG